MHADQSHRFRYPALVLIIGLGILTAIGSGGGGGGGGDDDVEDEPAPPLSSLVHYTAGTLEAGKGIQLALQGGTVDLTFSMDGSYAKGTRSYTVSSSSVPRIGVTTNGLPYTLLYDPFAIRIEQSLRWDRGAYPTAGQVSTTPGNSVRFTMTADAGGSGEPGVDIEWIVFDVVTASSSLTWVELGGVLDDPAAWEDYQVQAAFVYTVLAAVQDQLQLVLTGLEYVNLHDAALASAGSGNAVTVPCDLFAYDGSQGDFQMAWNDGPGSMAGSLGPGDHFGIAYHNCWTDEPGGDLATLFESGNAELRQYFEDAATLTLGYFQVRLDDVVETGTAEVAGVPTPTRSITVNTTGSGATEGFNLITSPDTSGTINLASAAAVAGAGVTSLVLPREVGNLGLGLLATALTGSASDFCDISGSVTIDPVPTSATTVPRSFALDFSACRREPADPSTLNGTATIDVQSVDGGTLAALATDDYTAALTVEAIQISTQDSVGTSTLTGSSGFARTAVGGDYTETSTSAGAGLSISEAGVTRVITPYTLTSTLATGGAFSFGATDETLTVDPSSISGALTITVIQPIAGSDLEAPAAGELRIAAEDGSTLTLTVVNGNVTLEIDSNGDGDVDDILATTWADLI